MAAHAPPESYGGLQLHHGQVSLSVERVKNAFQGILASLILACDLLCSLTSHLLCAPLAHKCPNPNLHLFLDPPWGFPLEIPLTPSIMPSRGSRDHVPLDTMIATAVYYMCLLLHAPRWACVHVHVHVTVSLCHSMCHLYPIFAGHL